MRGLGITRAEVGSDVRVVWVTEERKGKIRMERRQWREEERHVSSSSSKQEKFNADGRLDNVALFQSNYHITDSLIH